MRVELIYWDANAFLGLLQEEPEHVDLCRATFDRAESGEVLIVTSTLCPLSGFGTSPGK